MRSVNAASSKPRSRGRATASRRSAPARGAAKPGTYNRRAKGRGNLLSRFFRAIKNTLDPRRPVFAAMALLAVVGGIAFLFVAGYVDRATASVDAAAAAVTADAGLEVSTIQLTGNRYAPPGEIYAQLGFKPGDSIFAADAQDARARLRAVDWVADATVSVKYPDTVAVHVIEKVPFALWQSEQGLYAVERDGEPIAKVDPARFRALPLFFGDEPLGAFDLVKAIHSHRAVAARVKAMQSVSGRRWNLVLDDGVVVKLPEDNWAREIGALERLIVDNGVLERDIAEIDLRSHDNYLFVLRHPAPQKASRGEPT
jgi:cell division protein FtsQ